MLGLFIRSLILLVAVFVALPSKVRGQNDCDLPPISYATTDPADPVARLAKELASKDRSLNYDDRFGYLKSLLDALEISVASQTLVFSKTSLQIDQISPQTPRALYFNDDVYVGYCNQGQTIEIAATDAQQAAIFYTLSQSDSGQATLVRDNGQCLSCHSNHRTQNVPGYLLRSVYSDPGGRPIFNRGTFLTDSTSRLQDRWGGWYVSGTHGHMRHMGNVMIADEQATLDRQSGANLGSLDKKFVSGAYPSEHSDIVALMVLAHQTQMHNAIAAANYGARRAIYQSYEMNRLLERPEGYLSESANRRIDTAVQNLLQHLLFCEEFQLTDKVVGTTSFADEFESRGRLDAVGRSLRQFDLETRLFRYPCSYLIHSDAFNSLPEEILTRVFRRLHDVLDGQDDSPQFSHLDESTKKEIKEILTETISNDHWN